MFWSSTKNVRTYNSFIREFLLFVCVCVCDIQLGWVFFYVRWSCRHNCRLREYDLILRYLVIYNDVPKVIREAPTILKEPPATLHRYYKCSVKKLAADRSSELPLKANRDNKVLITFNTSIHRARNFAMASSGTHIKLDWPECCSFPFERFFSISIHCFIRQTIF